MCSAPKISFPIVDMFKIPGTFRACFSHTFLKDTKVTNQSSLDDENNSQNRPTLRAKMSFTIYSSFIAILGVYDDFSSSSQTQSGLKMSLLFQALYWE